MAEHGIYNRSFPVESAGLKDLKSVYYNLLPAELCEESIRRGEAVLTAGGALRARTSKVPTASALAMKASPSWPASGLLTGLQGHLRAHSGAGTFLQPL